MSLQSPYVSAYKESFFEPNSHATITRECCLDMHLGQNKSKAEFIKEKQIWRWLGQSAAALAQAHSLDLVHGDLDLSSLTLTAYGDIKLSNLSLKPPTTKNVHQLSPEIRAAQPYTTASDIWSLGFCFFDLCTATTKSTSMQ